jgi:hypothetical protein
MISINKENEMDKWMDETYEMDLIKLLNVLRERVNK